MSRIIVKNLPKHFNEDRFKEHFSTQGEVTDVKLIRTAQGKSRRFGYVGFRTEKEAKAAVRHFNETFIDTSKIVVEKAIPYGDAALPRPWSHHSIGSTGYYNKTGLRPDDALKEMEDKKKKRQDDFEKELKKKQEHIQSVYKEFENDKLKEFLQVMQPKTKTRTWANDDLKPETEIPKVKTNVTAVKSKKTGGEGILLTKTHVKFDDDSEDEMYEDMPAKSTEEDKMEISIEVPQQQPEIDSSVSDLDWLKSRMTMKPENEEETATPGSDNESDSNENKSQNLPSGTEEKVVASAVVDEAKPTPASQTQPTPGNKPSDLPPARPFEVPPAELIADTGRLFLRNLPYTCTEDDLKKLFHKFGPLSEIHMPIDKETKKPKGFAYILYLIPEHAVKAFFELDGKFFQGRLLHILPAKEKPQPPKEDESSMSIKKQKEAKRKAQSGNDFNWNSLFMSSDAIADSIADRLNVSKSEILNPDADNLAVRMAMAETHIITETKDYLEEHGICLDAFAKKERSDTVILVKNIPFGTAEEEFRELFGKHGSLGRVLIPPAQTIAVVEFLEPSEARAAFRHLAYKRFKNTLIYLEKAPVGVFRSEFNADTQAESKKAVASASMEDITQAEEEEDLDTVTLFIKNLNFDTTEESLRKTFEAIEGMRAVHIKTKPDPKNASKKLSMGFGFVEFASKKAAQNALKALQGVKLDDHTLQLKLSDKKSIHEPTGHRKSASSKKEGTKLLVKNIAFEATKKDLQQLFSNYGQLKTVRLPKKFSGGHRGFAFIEFLTKQEAKNVMNNLASTHLYGRHLVIEYAEEEKSIEEMRAKTEREFSKEEAMNPHKKQRIMMPGEEEEEEF